MYKTNKTMQYIKLKIQNHDYKNSDLHKQIIMLYQYTNRIYGESGIRRAIHGVHLAARCMHTSDELPQELHEHQCHRCRSQQVLPCSTKLFIGINVREIRYCKPTKNIFQQVLVT